MTSSQAEDGPNDPRAPSHSLTPPPMSPLTPANNELNDDLVNQALHPVDLGNRDPGDRAGGASIYNNATAENNNGFPAPVENGVETQLPPGDSANMSLHAPFGNPAMDIYDQRPLQTPLTPQNLMMALARISASQMALPPTVTPAQVSMSSALHNPGETLLHGNGHSHGIPAMDNPLESFARIEFADSVFQMTTYSVIIGRDQRALEQARRDERRTEHYQRRVEENAAQGLPPPSPPSQDRGKFSKSYVSEEGGMLGPESDGDDPRPTKRRKTSGAGSASGNSLQEAAMAVDEATPTDAKDPNLISNRQYVSHTPGAAAVDLASLRPSPHHVSFIGIHSPGPNIASRTKAISREHMKIQFNPDKGVFEAIPLHKNGFFCEDVHYRDSNVVLRSGDRLQVKDVEFVFVINGVPRRKTGAEDYLDEEDANRRRYSEGGKEMSFEFESSHAGEILSSPSVENQDEADVTMDKDDSGSELSDPGDDMDQDMENDVMETIEQDGDEDGRIKYEGGEAQFDLPPMPPKKRGPGRPPKNGIMSKREERLRKKMALEAAKKNMPPPPPGEPPIKRKVGRPRKHPLPENSGDKPEKRKYKPRKPKNEDGEEGSGAEKTVKEKRREKPKTPPLELRREDYTEDQLQKPNKNYGVLIDEVLTAAPDGLTLKQIYKRIQMKYPFYYFTVDTKGWESSVRHNLIGNDAFKKNEETHLWSRVPGIDIDAGKKRKAQSPDHSSALHHGYGPHHQHHQAHMAHTMYQGPHGQTPGYPAVAGQHVGYPHQPNQSAVGHPQQNFAPQAAGPLSQQQIPRPATYPAQAQPPSQVPNQTPLQTPAQTSAQIPALGYTAPAAARPVQAGSQPGAYSSPYVKQPAPAQQPVRPTVHTVPPQPGQAALPPSLANGLPRVATPSSQTSPMPHVPQVAGVGRPAAAPQNNGTAAAAYTSPIPPEHVKHITSFKKLVTEQLASRTNSASAPLAIAMSVINRGLDLTTQSMVDPEHQNLEKIVLGVFDTTRKNQNLRIEPGLLKVLTDFKTQWTKTLSGKLGQPKTEALLLSTINRVLGISDVSTMCGTEAELKEYEGAETMLMNPLRKAISEHQQRVAAPVST